jgi:hypothetical protein
MAVSLSWGDQRVCGCPFILVCHLFECGCSSVSSATGAPVECWRVCVLVLHDVRGGKMGRNGFPECPSRLLSGDRVRPDACARDDMIGGDVRALRSRDGVRY